MSQPSNAEAELRCPSCGELDSDRPFIGVEIRGVYDGPVIWECSTCKHRWPRFHPPGRLYDYAVMMLAVEKTMKENR
jgi:ribosomal protein L37AE/L43A